MTGSTRAVVCGLLAGLFCWGICGTSLAQDAPAPPEVVPAPQPSAVPQPARPQPTYGPLQAVQDAYQMAEQQRLQAVERQLQLVQSAWQYHAWPAPYYAPGVPYVYGYAYAYGPRRFVRRAYRHGYWAAPQPWPYAPAGVYAYPYSTWVRQPVAYQQIWIGPNSYVYRPYYGQPTGRPNVPTPSPPSVRSPRPPRAVPPAERPSGPVLNPPIQSAPEPIPIPPAEPAPGNS